MTAPYVPAPPPGPGVYPPFPAPPVEGKGKRTAWQLGVAGGVFVLIGLVIVVALGGISVAGVNIAKKQANEALDDYLSALAGGRFDDAYAQLCERARLAEDEQDFADDASSLDIASYTIGSFSLTSQTSPVDITSSDNDVKHVTAVFDQETSGRFAVCELRG